jgi:signal transduction histidine kinase
MIGGVPFPTSSRAYRWFDRHPAVGDSALAVGLALLAVTELAGGVRGTAGATRLTGVVLSIALAAPIPWRRHRPVTVFAVVAAVCLVQILVLDRLIAADAAALVALYTLVAYGPSRRLAGLGVGACLLGSVLGALAWTEPPVPLTMLANFVYFSALFALAAALGDRRRSRDAQVRALHEHNRLLAAERDSQAAIGAAVERARIARELHDVVAHSLSVIIVQADGGAAAAAHDPAVGPAVLGTIAETGRQALDEMRRLVGILRVSEDDRARYAPQPGPDELEELVRELAASGLPGRLDVQGVPRPLPGGTAVTVYRVVQEALTNVLKHAGRTARVEVLLRYREDDVEVRVTDDGRGADADDDGRGSGLLGMRERIELQGGTLRAGPLTGGGFEVRATLPAPIGS